MVKVKKLINGRVSLRMDYVTADQLAVIIMSFLEREMLALISVRFADNWNRHFVFPSLDELFRKHSGKLLGAKPEYNYVFTRSEAMLIVWALRELQHDKEVIPLLEIKSSLLQVLS